jgi:hypothetical protein
MTCREPPCRVTQDAQTADTKGASIVEHVVFFPAHDGSPAFRRVANLEDAVRLVEHLRNIEGVNEVSCHALTEVPLSFRAYYRVEVPAAVEEVAVDPAQPEAHAVEVDVPVMEDAVAAPQVEPDPSSVEPVMASANGHATDGAKSLGFFA